jgi:hypothetical protein
MISDTSELNEILFIFCLCPLVMSSLFLTSLNENKLHIQFGEYTFLLSQGDLVANNVIIIRLSMSLVFAQDLGAL